MTTTTVAPHASHSRPISEISRFRRAAAAVGTLTPFLAPAATDDMAPALHADREEQAMHRLRHPFASE
ncbi:hypothetical protein [Actinoplanes sp. CA-252034]|uniref:hypothetical protein n=1 Tax=Actinoplanes sp. CA-252034 TaxID=3239906 RepID=UPI003D97CEDA